MTATETLEETICRNPATGEEIGVSPLHTVDNLRMAIDRARTAQPEWAATPVKVRAAAIRRVRDIVAQRADELTETISRDNGKTLTDALATEVLPAAMAADYYARNAIKFLKDRKLRPASVLLGNKKSRIHHVPYGVVGIISPWNYPLAIPFSEVVMALLAGNSVVLKVATQTQLVGRAIERLFHDAGLPKGVFTYVNLPGRVAGDAFLEAGVNKLFFTGSVSVGKQLMAKAAKTLTPLVLELGGNDAMLVCPDANLVRAAGGAVWAGFQNAGQSCGGVERVYVHAAVYDAFLEKLAAKVQSLRVGADHSRHGADMGCMTTAEQARKVQEHVEEAVAAGAAVFAESSLPEGAGETLLPARVLTGVDHTMRIMREETFGPVLAVMKVADMEEALRLANDSDLGLTASVWSKNRREADRLARRIQAGVVMINDHLMSHGLAETPWGGFKQSGIGRTHGQLGFDEMTQPQCIVDDTLGFLNRNLWWPPYDPDVYAGVRGLINLLYGQKLATRLSGLSRLTKVLPRTWRK
ncbi:MAG: aldehyde dehydrogenase family protein [Planctomycetota bacterium]|nr:MAG: aldehyde dehydrogenase family protein [Planctomycetota bacterium]REK20475.1 MAG: aldehyde dehydrogenase family protein [Planctomycetota bacterium]REK33861.1 MAG: aldehyde dehydrogenase family protein [Planctomycetota bacterium]